MLGIEELVGRRDVVGLGVGKYAHGEYVGNDDSLSTVMGTYVCTGKQ